MSDLLESVIAAHGGLSQWRARKIVQATIVTGGSLWGMKDLVQDPAPRTMTVWLHEERASVMPFGAPDQRTAFTPERIAIEKTDGAIVAERLHPREAFNGHQQTTPWDPLHRAYFNGYALWTYLTTPFLLATPDVDVHEVEPITEEKGVGAGCVRDFPHISRPIARFKTSSSAKTCCYDVMTTTSTLLAAFLPRSMCTTMSKPTASAYQRSGAHLCVDQMTE